MVPICRHGLNPIGNTCSGWHTILYECSIRTKLKPTPVFKSCILWKLSLHHKGNKFFEEISPRVSQGGLAWIGSQISVLKGEEVEWNRLKLCPSTWFLLMWNYVDGVPGVLDFKHFFDLLPKGRGCSGVAWRYEVFLEPQNRTCVKQCVHGMVCMMGFLN